RALPTDSAAAPASNAIASVFILFLLETESCPRQRECTAKAFRSAGNFDSRESVAEPGKFCSELDRLVGFGGAVVVVLDAAAVDDGVAIDGDAIGLGAQRLAHHGIKVGPDAGGPVQAGRLAARRGDAHARRLRGRGE